MAVMPNVKFVGRVGSSRYVSPNPVGCILHRTESPKFETSLQHFRTTPHYPHFLIGKQGEVAQITDTAFRAAHVGNANAYYLGIELSSVTSRWPNRQDPRVIQDALTPAQNSSLRTVVNWVAATQQIPKVGPPSLKEMRDAQGQWPGFCNHADVSLVINSSGDHEEGLEDQEYLGLGIWPATTRQGQSSMSDLLPKLQRGAMSPPEKAKFDSISRFLAKISKS